MLTPQELYSYMPYALHLTKNKGDAEDLLHDAFERLWRCEYREEGKKEHMVKVVIFNKYIDKWRKIKKNSERVKLMQVVDRCFQPDFEEDEMLERQKAKIARFIFNLSDRDKLVMELYFDGLEIKEIASLIGMNHNATSAVIFRLKNKLSPFRKKGNQKRPQHDEENRQHAFSTT